MGKDVKTRKDRWEKCTVKRGRIDAWEKTLRRRRINGKRCKDEGG
jgi:hypothetical protein